MKNFSDSILLSTKLKMPNPRKNYIIRDGLFDMLSQYNDMGLIYICGGAGTGKTTLLSSFIHEKKLKNLGWISLDKSNSNIYSFWLYFTAAVNSFLENQDDLMTMMRSNTDISYMEKHLIILINKLMSDKDYYIVLDDFHWIEDKSVLMTLEFFIQSMPPNLHIFILSRKEPSLYLAPISLSGRLLYIDSKEMNITKDEGLDFLKKTLMLSENQEELIRLSNYAEGWIGGLQLTIAAGYKDKGLGAKLYSKDAMASQYLSREIFESLSEKEQDFLIKTGFLSYFDADICTEFLDDFSKNDFYEMIENLYRKNLFLICIDEEKQVYRYHNILADYLTKQLSSYPKEYVRKIHHRSASAFENKGDLEEALKLFTQINDYENMMRIARNNSDKMELMSYLNTIPIDKLEKDLDLLAQSFMYSMGSLDMKRCRKLYDVFIKKYGGTDIYHSIKFAETFVSADKDILPSYHTLEENQIDALPFGTTIKSFIQVGNSISFLGKMQYEQAIACCYRALESTNIVSFFAYDQLAQIYEEIGQLNKSLSSYEKAEEFIQSPLFMSGVSINFYFGITGIYMLAMEINKAKECLQKAEDLLKTSNKHWVSDFTLHYHLAEMEFLTGNIDAGVSYVESILSKYPDLNILTLDRLLYAMECSKKLPQTIKDTFLEELESNKEYKIQPFMRILRARIIFNLDESEEAFHEIEEVLTFCRMRKNYLRLIEAGLLKIYMLSESPKNSKTQLKINNLLIEAIHYACNDRIIMPFYLNRHIILAPLERLLEHSRDKDIFNPRELAFIRDIISLSRENIDDSVKKDILTPRELEVLRELSRGITNKEIAENLCISQATVKTHILNIYSKLQVSSRLMAVEEARKRGIS